MRDALLLLLAVGCAALCSACSPTYVARAALEEARILQARRPMDSVIHDTATASDVRHKLRLVQDARYFAVTSIGLDAGDSFESFAEVDRDTLLMVVSAAPAFQLAWKTWWFPIVGRVPYRGYFDADDAGREAARLAERGYDVYVRPSSAFSTLGWLPDPLLSSMLRADSAALVETVIHEITHTTYFPRGQVQFNESFANFVGHRGAIAFFCDRTADAHMCELATDRWHDSRVLGRFYRSLYDSLQQLYARPLPETELATGKREIIGAAVERFADRVRPQLRAAGSGVPNPDDLNNAWLMARVLYYQRLDDFEAIYRRFGDLGAAVSAIIADARHTDPWQAVDRLKAGSSSTARATP